MAGEARARRALEYGVHVARLARLQLVRAGQFVAGGHVVELRAGALRECAMAGERQHAENEDFLELAHGFSPTAAVRP